MDSDKRATVRKLSGAAIALAAAGMFLSGTTATVSAADEAQIHCVGVNACKGQTECKTAKNDCKGQNACKGKGFLPMTSAECKAKGGKIEES
jgi:hypothetical protein